LISDSIGADLIAVQAGLTFNYGEFATIKVGIVNTLPYAEKLDGVAVPQPVRNKKIAIFRLEHIGQGNVVLILLGKNGDGRPLNIDG